MKPVIGMTIEGWDVLEHARRLSEQGQALALATVVWRRGPTSGKEGYRAVITETGEVHGWIGGACAEPAVVREARRVLAEGTPRLMFFGTAEEVGAVDREDVISVPISCQSEGALEVYIEPVGPRPHLVVIGRSPMVEALVTMAKALGWTTVMVDPAGGSAEPATADRVVAGLDLEEAGVTARSLVVVATQGHNDEEALEKALAAEPAYVGLVGSRKRGASVLGYLEDRGVSAEALQRVQVPAGQDLGRISHREIAVAILAELVRRRAAGELAEATPVELPEVEEATDPVCGMTVDVGTRHTAEHDGVTYYFCCPGCRAAFRKNPVEYVASHASS